MPSPTISGRALILALAAGVASLSAAAQAPGTPHPLPTRSADSGTRSPIHPEVTGDALLAALAVDFTPTDVLSYDRARDSLFAAVYAEFDGDDQPTDSLRCAYTGKAVWIDPALDPTTAGWNASPRFSTEHVWTQSMGASEGTPARSDLHHLLPVQQSVNSSRGNVPFGETEDGDVDKWYGPAGGYLTSPPPLAVRDLFSEKLNGGDAARFEAREDRAGDTARAMFYVYAVYGPHGVGQLDLDFWAAQRDVLLDWHEQDPPDQAEIDRTQLIASWQGTPNPFVLDATLAARAFGPPPVVAAVGAFTGAQAGDGLAAVTWTTTAENGVATFHIDGRPDVFGSSWTEWGTTAASGQPSSYAVTAGGLAVNVYRVRLRAITDGGGTGSGPGELTLGEISLTIGAATDGEDNPNARPFTLSQPVPNPASGSAVRATLTLAQPVHVLAVVYDALGREVAVVHDALASGTVEVAVDSTQSAPGVYVLRAVAVDGSAAESRRFTVAR